MPNWCSNEVDIIASEDSAEELKAFIRKARLSTTEYPQHFFDQIVPMPKVLRNSQQTFDNEEHFNQALTGNKKLKYDNWYNWRLAHWGTKWDAQITFCDIQNNQITLNYETAWSPALDFLEEASNRFPNLVFKTRYWEEGNGFIGEAEYKNGECLKDVSLEFNDKMTHAAGVPMDEDGNLNWDAEYEWRPESLFDGGLEQWKEN